MHASYIEDIQQGIAILSYLLATAYKKFIHTEWLLCQIALIAMR